MLKEIFLSVIISVDLFLAAAACSSSSIRIPLLSVLVTDLISAAILGISMTFSDIICGYIPLRICRLSGTVMMMTIGIVTISKSLIRGIVRHLSEKKGISLKIGSCSLLLRLYLDDSAADMDSSKVLSVREASALALAGSLDCAAAGLSCGCTDVSPLYSSIFTLICGGAALLLGAAAGRKISSLDRDLSWLGGVLLIFFSIFTL